jgi:hypothetical protein
VCERDPDLSARKLNHTGYVERRCDTETKVKKLQNALRLTHYSATFTREHNNDDVQNMIEMQAPIYCLHLAPKAISKL